MYLVHVRSRCLAASCHYDTAKTLTNKSLWVLGRLANDNELAVEHTDLHIPIVGIVVCARLVKGRTHPNQSIVCAAELFLSVRVVGADNPELAPGLNVLQLGQQDAGLIASTGNSFPPTKDFPKRRPHAATLCRALELIMTPWYLCGLNLACLKVMRRNSSSLMRRVTLGFAAVAVTATRQVRPCTFR